MKASEIEIEFINTDYSPALTERCKLSDLKALERAQDKEITLISAWIDPKHQIPQEDKKLIFKLKNNDKRMGTFMLKDQWDRPNIFCDGAFHQLESVKGYYYVID